MVLYTGSGGGWGGCVQSRKGGGRATDGPIAGLLYRIGHHFEILKTPNGKTLRNLRVFCRPLVQGL